MAKLLSEINKVDVALVPQSLNGGGTGEYFSMGLYGKALAVVTLGAMATGVTSTAQIMQAQDSSGTGAKVINDTAGNAANIVITSADGGAAVLLDNTAIHVADDTYTINGLTFTAAAADGGAASRTYAVGANVGACCANLAAKINDPAIGVPGVTASVSGNDVLLVADEPGETTITVTTSVGAQGVPVTQRAVGYIEIDPNHLDLAGGFDHIALRVTNSAAVLTGGTLIRGECRYSPLINQVAEARINVEP